MLESLTLASFAGRVGESFRISSDADGITLDSELIEATQVGATPSGGRRAAFSLVFRAAADVVLPQQIYRVEHAELGVLDIFLVPIGPDGSGMRYEAVFT